MENYDEHKESSYIQYLDAINLYGWAMPQKLPKNNFKWVEDTSRINDEFIKNYNENSNRKEMLNILRNYMIYIVIYNFYREE